MSAEKAPGRSVSAAEAIMNDKRFQNYRVRLTETVIEEAYVVVRARSAEEATEVAERAVFRGEADRDPKFTRVNVIDSSVSAVGETDEPPDYDACDFTDDEGGEDAEGD